MPQLQQGDDSVLNDPTLVARSFRPEDSAEDSAEDATGAALSDSGNPEGTESAPRAERGSESLTGASAMSRPESGDSYFDDDEAFLPGDDDVIGYEESIGFIQQLEGVVSWELVNFYGDDGKPRSKSSLRSEPPVLRISSSDGAVAQFVVTRELARTLSDVFADVHKGYFGVQPKKRDEKGNVEQTSFSQEGFGRKGEELKTWALNHPVQVFLFALLVILAVVSPFVFS